MRILLTLPVTVAAEERSFSKLKFAIVESHDRFNSLALISKGYKICDEPAFDYIAHKFAIIKSSKINSLKAIVIFYFIKR
jgi:hypothetical protein